MSDRLAWFSDELYDPLKSDYDWYDKTLMPAIDHGEGKMYVAAVIDFGTEQTDIFYQFFQVLPDSPMLSDDDAARARLCVGLTENARLDWADGIR